MRKALLLLLFAAGLGCNRDPLEPPKPENVTRAWQVTRCKYVSTADPAVSVDLVQEGWAVLLIINDNNRFFYVTTPPGDTAGTITGAWRIEGQQLILAPDGVPYEWSFTARVHETTMRLGGAGAEWDFNDDGTPDPATWNLAMKN